MRWTDRFPTRTIAVASIALNLALFAYFVRTGALRRALLKADLVEAPLETGSGYEAMLATYRKLPSPSGDLVFAGDSLVSFGPWAEFFPGARNRGIRGETSAQLLGRIGEILQSHPRRLVLLIGANDYGGGVPLEQLLRHDRAILEAIRAARPRPDVTLIAMLPVNRTFPGAPNYDNPAILEANRRLEALVRDFPDARFLDPTARLIDESGRLRREFTDDGLHLNLDGYLALIDALAPALGGSIPPQSTKAGLPADRSP